MSLFGGSGQNKPAEGSLFGNTPAPGGQTTGGLFGSAPASSGQTTGGLFQTSQPQQSGGLFSSTAQPTQTGLFGGASTSTQAKPSLFANSTASTGGGLFGNAQTQSQPPNQGTVGSGLFSNMQPTTNQQNNTSTSLFPAAGASTAQQPGQHQIPPAGQLAQSTAGLSQSAYFDHLLERGKKRNKQEHGAAQFDELPSLQLGLGDIARKVRNLGAGGPSAQQARDSKAHYILAASGVPTGKTLKDLNSFNSQTNVPHATQAVDNDVESYIAGLQSQSTLAMIAEGLEQSKRDFDTFLEENVQMEWDAQRKRIYEHLGLVKPGDDLGQTAGRESPAARGAFGKSSRRSRPAVNGGVSVRGANAAKSVIGTPSTSRFGRSTAVADTGDRSGPGAQPDNVIIRSKQDKFAAKVQDLNTARDQGRTFAVLQNFLEVEKQSGTADTTSQLVDAYRALVSITKETNTERPSDPGAVVERQYAQAYLDDNANAGSSIALRKQILSGSLQFLETKFMEDVTATVDRYPEEAKVGGIPTKLNVIRGYIRIRAGRKELGPELEDIQRIGDDYCWAIIFYLLRAGLLEEAIEYVATNERAFKNLDRRFLEYLRAYARDPLRKLPGDKQRSIATEYKNRAQSPNLDPYRQACHKIIGRCELGKRTVDGINQGMDDFIWLQFNLAREINRVEDTAGESFTLEDVRNMVSDIGQRHFPPGAEGTSGHAVFFYLQILAGMFEQAVNYLYQHNYVSAIHYAIALDYYGLLRVSDFATSGSETLTFTTRQKAQLNFARMIGLYTIDFRAAKPDIAVDYLVLIALNADLPGQIGKTHAEVAQEALRELVLETREFATLIGDIRNDGQRIRGTIEHKLRLIKLDSKDFLRKVTLSAARVADNNGRMTDAVLLYYLGEDASKSLDVVHRIIIEFLGSDLGSPQTQSALKPRVVDARSIDASQSSLSLLATEDPMALGHAFLSLKGRWMSFGHNSGDVSTDENLLELLLMLVEAKRLVEAGAWSEAIDKMSETGLLPLNAEGNTQLVRRAVTNMNSHDAMTRLAGNFILWAILCCGRQREVLLSREYVNQNSKNLAEQLLQKARDLMVFAGLIRYKLSPRVYEVLAEVGQDVGV